MLAGGMSRDSVIISTVTTLELGIAGIASDPTAARTLKTTPRSRRGVRPSRLKKKKGGGRETIKRMTWVYLISQTQMSNRSER